MLTIDSQRTNGVPTWLVVTCVGLIFLKCMLIAYRVYCPQTVGRIEWQAARAPDTKRTDLLAKPYLYFFCDHREFVSGIMSDLFSSAVFNNREIIQFMRDHFEMIKVDSNKPESELSQKLRRRYHVFGPFKVVATLVDGTRIDSCGPDTDRGFMAFLREANSADRYEMVAETAMSRCDFKAASDAFALVKSLNGKAEADRTSLYQVFWWAALRHQHHDAEASQVLQNAYDEEQRHSRFTYRHSDWNLDMFRFLMGKISQEEYMKKEKYYSKYACGEQLLLAGKPNEAKKMFEECIAKGATWNFGYRLASAELRAMNNPDSQSKNDDYDDQGAESADSDHD